MKVLYIVYVFLGGLCDNYSVWSHHEKRPPPLKRKCPLAFSILYIVPC